MCSYIYVHIKCLITGVSLVLKINFGIFQSLNLCVILESMMPSFNFRILKHIYIL